MYAAGERNRRQPLQEKIKNPLTPSRNSERNTKPHPNPFSANEMSSHSEQARAEAEEAKNEFDAATEHLMKQIRDKEEKQMKRAAEKEEYSEVVRKRPAQPDKKDKDKDKTTKVSLTHIK